MIILGICMQRVTSAFCDTIGFEKPVPYFSKPERNAGMTSYYIQTNLICMILLVGLGTLLHKKKGTLPARQLAFSRLILFTSFLCISDVFAWSCNGKSFVGVRVILELSNMIYYAAITWTCYAWLNYVNVCIQNLEYDHRKRMVLSAIPVITMTIIIFLNPLTHFLFSFDSNNVYARGNGVLFHWLISWGYLLYATGQVVHRIRNAKSKLERKSYYPLLWFIVLPVTAAVAQMFFYGMTAMQCGITLSTVMISFGNQQEQISSDTLTGLNNRKALENYLSNKLMKQGQQFFVIFCDIDHFKAINDTLGHAKGDIALKRVAGVLRRACGRASEPLFLCRYGGDEFVICGVDISGETLLSFTEDLHEELSIMNMQHPDEQPLDISMGRAEGFCTSEDDVEKLIHLADTSMYENKNGKRL